MFMQLLFPALCVACNVWGGVGVGYAYSDIGISANWVARKDHSGRFDEDALMVAAQWQAVHFGAFSVGPYVGRTITPDGKGPGARTVYGGSVQWNF